MPSFHWNMLIAILCPWIWQIVWLVPSTSQPPRFYQKIQIYFTNETREERQLKDQCAEKWHYITQRCLSFSIFETYAFDCVRKTNVWLLALGLYAFHRHTIKLFFSGGGIRQGNRLETRFGNFISRFKLSNILKTIWWES